MLCGSLPLPQRMKLFDDLCETCLQAKPRGAVNTDAYPTGTRGRVIELPVT